MENHSTYWIETQEHHDYMLVLVPAHSDSCRKSKYIEFGVGFGRIEEAPLQDPTGKIFAETKWVWTDQAN